MQRAVLLPIESDSAWGFAHKLAFANDKAVASHKVRMECVASEKATFNLVFAYPFSFRLSPTNHLRHIYAKVYLWWWAVAPFGIETLVYELVKDVDTHVYVPKADSYAPSFRPAVREFDMACSNADGNLTGTIYLERTRWHRPSPPSMIPANSLFSETICVSTDDQILPAAIVYTPAAKSKCLTDIGSPIKAALEFGRRLVLATAKDRQQVRYPSDAAQMLMAKMVHLEQERFCELLLDTRSRIMADLWSEPVLACGGKSLESLHNAHFSAHLGR